MLRKKKTLKKKYKRKKKSLKSKRKKLRGGASLESITERLGRLGEAISSGGEKHLILLIEKMKEEDLFRYLEYYKLQNKKLDDVVEGYRKGNEKLIWPPELGKKGYGVIVSLKDGTMYPLDEFNEKLEKFRGEFIEHMNTKFERLSTEIDKLQEETDLEKKDQIYEETKKIYTDAKNEIIDKTKFVIRISQYLSTHAYEKELVEKGIISSLNLPVS